jgi:translation initiation factor 1A
MVKNKKGGRNNRKMASKHAQPTNTTRTRFAKDEDEMYAKVVRMLGGRRAEIICNDKKTRILEIRKKFGGRNKRDNFIAQDSVVLVGVRSWEHRQEGKKEKADLLYVYSTGQLERLKNEAHIDDAILPNSMTVDDKEEMCFIISNTETWEDKLSEIKVDAVKQNIKLSNNEDSKNNDDDIEFDFDDI